MKHWIDEEPVRTKTRSAGFAPVLTAGLPLVLGGVAGSLASATAQPGPSGWLSIQGAYSTGPITASMVAADTLTIPAAGTYNITFISGAGAEVGGPAGVEWRHASSLELEFSPPVDSFADGLVSYHAGAQVRYNPGWGGDGEGDTYFEPDPATATLTGVGEIAADVGGASERWAYAHTVLDYEASHGGIRCESAGRARAVAAQNQSNAGSLGQRQWNFVTSGPTTITFHATFAFTEVTVPVGPRGSSPSNPQLPENSAPPFTFPPIPSNDWVDPPSIYGYRYELADALVTAVRGWSPYLDGPVRVSVGSVDLGWFAETEDLVFADYASALGGLLEGGVGVRAFEVTEITPRAYENDLMGFPVQLEYSEPSTSTLVMSPIEEPQVTAVLETSSGPPWAGLAVSASPNPFRPTVQVQYHLPSRASVTASVFDVRGRRVRELVSGIVQEPGDHELTWRGHDDVGRSLPSGVYFVQIDAGDLRRSLKLTLLR
ncbi:MAG: FlgD immunoglobulin-like domain containing protein [bacterium]